MNIFLTGATGFIGRHLLHSLKSEHTVHILVRPYTNLSEFDAEHIFVFNDNILELSDYLVSNRIDGIVHLASLYISQHKAEEIRSLCLSNIYLGTAILEAAKVAKIKWFLNTGTIWQHYISDSLEYCPVNLYAASKQAFMDMAKYYIETTDIRFCTLKLCDTYGPGDTRRKIFALFEQIALSGETLDMSLGNQKMDIIHIDDVVSGFSCLIELLDSNELIKDEYVLSSGERHTLKELATLYEKINGVELHINWGGRSYREREVMEPWKRGQILPGWQAKISLQEGLAKISRFCGKE